MRIDVTIRDPDGTEHDAAIPAGTCAGLRTGAVVSGGAVAAAAAAVSSEYRLEVVGGPDAGCSIALGPARASLGRHPDCTLVLTDPDVSRRHAEVWIGPQGPQVRELGSANGTSVEGEQVTDRPVALGPQQYLRLGDTVLCVRRDVVRPALTHDGPDGAVLLNRPPVPAEPTPEVEIALADLASDPPPQHLPWLAALVPAVAGAGLALAFHSVQFLLFAGLSPLALLATALGDRWHRRRARRRASATHRQRTIAADRQLAAALATETRARRAWDPDPAAVLAIVTLPGAALWARSDETALRVRVGLGRQPAHARGRDGPLTRSAGTVELVPIVVEMADGPLGIAAPAPIAAGLARWLVGQLCAHHPPAELQLALLLSPASEPGWRWARWLPHLGGRVAATPGEHATLVAELADAAMRPGQLVLVVDRHGALADTAGLADLLAAGTINALCVDEHEAALPAACTSVLVAAGESGNRAVLRTGAQRYEVITDRVGPDWADRVARALAPLRDTGSRPEAALPGDCRLLPRLGDELGDGEACAARWAVDSGGLDTVLGIGAAGPCVVDLARDGPHALVAGTTGSGKSEVLRALVAGLAIRHSPEAVTFVLIDYKGGAAFAECARLPHTVGVVTDLDPHAAQRALRSLTAELTRRERLLAEVAARDLGEYRAAGAPQPLPRLVIVVDEFAELAGELGDFVTGLVAIARRGRSLGVHLVLATQRPGGSISAEIRANTALRICLRVSDPTESRDVIGTDAAATITPRAPGRAYLQLAGGAPQPVQVAHLGGDPYARTPVVPLDHWRRPPGAPANADDVGSDLPAVVATLRAAAAQAGIDEPHAPWLPPLPELVPAGELTGRTQSQVPLGLLDLPAEQSRRALFADLAAPQSLLVAGAPRTGRTSALVTLAVGATAQLPPDVLQLYAIDFAGGGLGVLGALPHTGSLIGPDAASAALLVRRLLAEAGRRREAAGPAPPVLLLLDGWEEFSAALDELDAGRSTDTLLELLRAGPSAGFSTAIAGGRGTFAPRLAGQVAVRLLLPLSDRNDAALAGVPPARLPTTLCPGRAVRVGDGAELQLAHLGAAPTAAEQRRAIERVRARWRDSPGATGAVRVRPLPRHVELANLVDLAKLVDPDALPARPDRLVLGVGGDAAEPVAVDLFAGQARLLVAGPPRSGRSTVLRVLLLQLLALDVPTLVAAPARSPLMALAIERHVPVLRPGEQPPDRLTPLAVLVDDSAAFLDAAAGDALTILVRDAPAGLAAVAAGDSGELAVTFRGVAAEVRRSRCAVLLAPGPADGELAGVRLPRQRGDVPPGRGVLVGDPAWGLGGAGPIPLQVALP